MRLLDGGPVGIRASVQLRELDLGIACVCEIKVAYPIARFSTICALDVARPHVLNVKELLNSDCIYEEP